MFWDLTEVVTGRLVAENNFHQLTRGLPVPNHSSPLSTVGNDQGSRSKETRYLFDVLVYTIGTRGGCRTCGGHDYLHNGIHKLESGDIVS